MQDNIYLLGIDPGTNLGLSIIELDSMFNILSIKTITYIQKEPIMFKRLYNLSYYIHKILEAYQPVLVGMEAAFMHAKYPKAVIVLTEYITTIETTIRNFNSFTKIYKYPPKFVKSMFTSSGIANKEDMLYSLNNILEIRDKIDLSNVTEHEVDATAIAYTALADLRKDYLRVLVTD